MALSKKDALAAVKALKRPTKEVAADELEDGATLLVQEPSSADRDVFQAAMQPKIKVGASEKEQSVTEVETGMFSEMKFKLLPNSIVDEDGQPIFSQNQVRGLPPALTDRLWGAWVEFIGESAPKD